MDDLIHPDDSLSLLFAGFSEHCPDYDRELVNGQQDHLDLRFSIELLKLLRDILRHSLVEHFGWQFIDVDPSLLEHFCTRVAVHDATIGLYHERFLRTRFQCCLLYTSDAADE